MQGMAPCNRKLVQNSIFNKIGNIKKFKQICECKCNIVTYVHMYLFLVKDIYLSFLVKKCTNNTDQQRFYPKNLVE